MALTTSTLIASGTAAASSAVTTLSDGETVTLSLTGTGSMMLVSVDDLAVEQDEERLSTASKRSVQISGPYRFKLRRDLSKTAIGAKMFRG